MSTIPTITFVPGPTEMSPATDLKKPYKWVMPIKTVSVYFQELQQLLDSLTENKGGKPLMQCAVHSRTNLRYGVNTQVFLLCPNRDAIRESVGMNKKEWNAATKKLTNFLQKYFPGCKPYVEPHTTERKFKFTFETHIMYEELKDLVKQPKKKNK